MLASQSPRRLELLRQVFPAATIEQRLSSVDEARFFDRSPGARCEALSQLKATTVLARYASDCQGQLVLAADTEVVLDGQPLGKPSDEADAVTILERLSGCGHQVITGFTLRDSNGLEHTQHVSSQVYFKPLSAHIIQRYVETGEPADKAGAYGIQGQGAVLIDRIEGSYSNIVGLPLEALCDALMHTFDFA